MKTVFTLGFTAFGGPQVHIPVFVKRFVDKHKLISRDELLEINAFCNILPGPSTTQTITAMGFKIGGPGLAFLSLLAWIFPGAVLMTILTVSPKFLARDDLRFLQPMVAAFLCHATVSYFGMVRKGFIYMFIFFASGLAGFLTHSPVVFPVGIVVGGYLSSRFGNRAFVPNLDPIGRIRWANLSLYLIIFMVIAALGWVAHTYGVLVKIGRPLVLLENTYRMGSLTFGGGHSLSAMILDQYVHHAKRMSTEELNIGLGLIQAMPGPNFNIAAYINGISMKNYGYNTLSQILTSAAGIIAIFMPGTLLIFFGFPLWNRAKKYPIIQRSLDGIVAASAGFILSAAMEINLYFLKTYIPFFIHLDYFLVWVFTMIILTFTKLPSPFIVLGTIFAGVLLPV